MLVALYIGNHAQDSLLVRAGWAATRYSQKGEYKDVTHTEVIHAQHADGSVDIASATLRDGGVVRVKPRVMLNPEHWRIASVNRWDVERSKEWYAKHDGELYDIRGAWATVMPGHQDPLRWFCNESNLASIGWKVPHTYGPAHFAGICFSLGEEQTIEFFEARRVQG